jgi:hypothetical protein
LERKLRGRGVGLELRGRLEEDRGLAILDDDLDSLPSSPNPAPLPEVDFNGVVFDRDRERRLTRLESVLTRRHKLLNSRPLSVDQRRRLSKSVPRCREALHPRRADESRRRLAPNQGPIGPDKRGPKKRLHGSSPERSSTFKTGALSPDVGGVVNALTVSRVSRQISRQFINRTSPPRSFSAIAVERT